MSWRRWGALVGGGRAGRQVRVLSCLPRQIWLIVCQRTGEDKHQTERKNDKLWSYQVCFASVSLVNKRFNSLIFVLNAGSLFLTPEGRKRERWETKQDDSKQRARESNDQTKRKTSMWSSKFVLHQCLRQIKDFLILSEYNSYKE